MSQSRREARRAESLNPRDRRRRRLNSLPSNSTSTSISTFEQPTEFVSSWLDQQFEIPAQPVSPVEDSTVRLQATLRDHPSFALSDSLPLWTQHEYPESSMPRIDPAARMQTSQATAGPSSAPPPARNARNGPFVTLDQIVSKSQPPSEAQRTSSASLLDADIDESSTEDTDSTVSLGFPLSSFSWRPTHAQAFSTRARPDDLFGSNSRQTKRSYPENPAVVLAYQVDRNCRDAMRFLPFVPVSEKKNSKKTKRYMIQPEHKHRIDASQMVARRSRWVPELPVELFELITQHLSRDDIKAMRLVSKEFELGVSNSLFDTVVVPFNTELYDMIEQERIVVKRDKGKRRADDPEPGSLPWKNAMDDREDKVYRGHGLQVFQGFGGHIRRFGMSFEINEDALRDPPQKNVLDHHESYFGSYDWPSQEYTRFEKLAGLERTADETSQMKLAFSHLTKVQQLALSMDSGLGWMNGPDRSLRSLIVQRPAPVFGCSHGIVDAQRQERMALWETLESAYDDELKEGHLERMDLGEDFFQLPSLLDTPYVDPELWARAPATTADTAEKATGALYISSSETRDPDTERQEINKRINKLCPSSLTKHQKEWLLEAEWAQRAFLTTYMLGIVDNGPIFNKVSILNLARISSHLVPLLSRDDFWDALPKLKEVTLGVIPDWRTVEKDDAGFIETHDIDPSHAVEKAYDLINNYIGPRPIQKLSFSWAAGGEHAEGIFARNHHILPAPITIVSHSTTIQNDDRLINLPYVRELAFSNCWFTPISIENTVKKLRKASLRKLKLDSVSLTANPRNVAANQNAVAGAQAPGMQAPGMVMLGVAAQLGAQVWQGPQPGVPAQQWAQGMLQNLNATIQQQGVALQQLPQVWTNHPTGMTMQQIVTALTAIAGGQHLPPIGVLYQQQGQQQQPQAQFPVPGFPPLQPQMVMPQAQNNAPLLPQPMAMFAPAPVHHNHNHNAQAAPPSNRPWYEGHRSGSWVKLIDKLSPGPRLEMYQPRGEFEPEPERRKKGLMSIEFSSCGYVQLRSATFDQNVVESPASYRMSRYFIRRQGLMSSSMLSTNDKFLGTIVQYMSEREAEALRNAWGMSMGWSDRKLAEEAEYDGYLPGGTGRFSGSVTKDTLIQEAYVDSR